MKSIHGRRMKDWLSSKAGQWTFALVAILVLDLIVFRSYFLGRGIPLWDFVEHYNTEAFAWWRDGSFFSPVEWLPYVRGGYPGVLDLQNSSWYLPVGLVSAVVPFTLWASAVLSALHVAFGALGAFVLVRRWRMTFSAQILALVAWFFVEGFYVHAEHVDIMRGFAWIPWVLLLFSPQYPWRKWWAPLVATLCLWQAILAAYPGQLAVGFYVLVVWLVCMQLFMRPRFREYLLPVVGAAAVAVALSMLRFLPFALVAGTDSPSVGTDIPWTWWHLGTFFYGRPGTGGMDSTMRFFFVPVVVFVLIGLVRWKHPLVKTAFISAITAWFLGFSIEPWSSFVDHFPGLQVSRFRMDDAKLMLLMMLTVLGAAGLDSFTGERDKETKTWLRWSRRVYWVLLLVIAGALGVFGPFERWSWAIPWMLMAAAVVIVVAGLWSRGRFRGVFALGLCVLTLVSGFFFAREQTYLWSHPRVEAEKGYGAPVSDLIALRDQQGDEQQRPPRAAPESASTDSDWLETEMYWENEMKWSASFYSGEYSILGEANLKAAPDTWDIIKASLLDPVMADKALAFWSAPGIGVAVDDQGGLPAPSVIEESVATGYAGGGANVSAVSYQPSTPFVYQVEASREVSLAFNEAHYNGWSAVATEAGGETRSLDVSRGSGGELLVRVPAGSWRLALSYGLPGLGWAWGIFAAAGCAVVAWTTVLAVRRWRDRKGHGQT